MQTLLQIFYPMVHQKSVLYVDSVSLNVRIAPTNAQYVQ